jgi:hypothetical protein
MAMVGIGTVTIALAGSWAKRSRVTALTKAIEILNEEICRTIESGACFTGIRGVETVIEALKAGGARVDKRLAAILQSDAEAETGEPRAIWDPRVQRFAISTDGGAGAREFIFTGADDTRMAA